MQLSVQGKQLDVGGALRTHIDDSLRRTLDKYFGDALEVKVTLTRDAHLYRAAIAAHVGRGIHLEANGEAGEPYPAFDSACDHLSKRLRRHKRRLRQHHKESAAELEILTAQQYILSDDSIVEILRGSGVDIARRTVAKYREAMKIPSSVQRRRAKAARS